MNSCYEFITGTAFVFLCLFFVILYSGTLVFSSVFYHRHSIVALDIETIYINLIYAAAYINIIHT